MKNLSSCCNAEVTSYGNGIYGFVDICNNCSKKCHLASPEDKRFELNGLAINENPEAIYSSPELTEETIQPNKEWKDLIYDENPPNRFIGNNSSLGMVIPQTFGNRLSELECNPFVRSYLEEMIDKLLENYGDK